MRNSKVKTLKKMTLFTLSLLLISAGATFAQTWSDVQSAANGTGDVSVTLQETELSAGSSLTPVSSTTGTTPPVPHTFTINGDGNTIKSTGFEGSVINNVNQRSVTIVDTNISNGVKKTDTSSSTYGGGAVYSDQGVINISSSSADNMAEFSENEASNGGAILNTGSSVLVIDKMKFTNNTANAEGSAGMGGAISNSSTAAGTNMTITNSIFTSNKAKLPSGTSASGGLGGAIYHASGTAKIENTTFGSNFANEGAGAIQNGAIMSVSENSNFENNYTNFYGGAIMNGSTAGTRDAELNLEDTRFFGNHAVSGGGAIYNRPSEVSTTNTVNVNSGTSFIGNYVMDDTTSSLTGIGGAIANDGKGSIYTEDAILNINGSSSKYVNFTNNVAKVGGAVYNAGDATINYAEFNSNGVGHSSISATNNLLTNDGGAIYNEKLLTPSTGILRITNSKFEGNKVSGYGGAIYNASQATITDTDFKDNAAGLTSIDGTASSANGGAIYTNATNNDPNATTTIIAKNRNVTIGSANSFDNKTDSIVFSGTGTNVATGNFLASNGKQITINSEVRGSVSNSVVNFGDYSGNYDNGLVKFDNKSKLSYTNVFVKSGTLKFEKDSGFDNTNILHMAGGTLDIANGVVSQIKPAGFNLDRTSTMVVDVDLQNEKMDTLMEGSTPFAVTGDSKLNLMMKAFGDTPTKNESIIQFTNSEALERGVVNVNPSLSNGRLPSKVDAGIHYYDVTQYDNNEYGDGVYYGFKRAGVTPSGISGPVAAQAAYIMMDNLYRQSFANMDMVALMTPEQRDMLKALQCGNQIDWKRAKGYHTGVFAPNSVPEERDGLYVRPFANFENVPLKNGPRISNVFYGSLIGGESDLIELGHGWDGTFSFFGAYHGSHQAYNGVDIWQNGGTLGAVGTVYKGRFFSGLTANVGASAAEAHHSWGHDQFPILMAGAAWKSGYNFGMLSNRLILQPSYMMSYTFVNVFDYNSSAGARITQDPLNAIEIIPGVKLIGNLKNGWQPYLGANMTWNIIDKTHFYANEFALPQLSVKPFIEYGLGLQKRYGDRFTGYGQFMFRNGGRNGVAMTMGLRWALGN